MQSMRCLFYLVFFCGFFRVNVIILIAFLLHLRLHEWIMSQLFISDVAGAGKGKGKKKKKTGGEGAETPSSRAVGGTVAPGCAAEGQLNGERAESLTVPVDSNNNGCACSTERPCARRGVIL